MSVVPFIQGDLDGACGIYAIINSIQACGIVPRNQLDSLCGTILNVARQKLSPEHFINLTIGFLTNGTYHPQISALLRVLPPIVPTLTMMAGRGIPERKDGYFNALVDLFGAGAKAVLIGVYFRGAGGHWTTVYDCSSRQLRLLDGVMKHLNFDQVTCGQLNTQGSPNILDPTDPWFIFFPTNSGTEGAVRQVCQARGIRCERVGGR